METHVDGLRCTLGTADLVWALGVGRQRYENAMQRGYATRFGESKDTLEPHLRGACGELAVARITGRTWTGHVERFRHGPDIEDTDWEVRWSERECWKVAEHDNGCVVCIEGARPTLTLIGWLDPVMVRDRLTASGYDKGKGPFWLLPSALWFNPSFGVGNFGKPPHAYMGGITI